MARRFADALAQNPAPPRDLGDVRLGYDAPVLVGKAKARATAAPAVALVAATALGLTTLAAFFAAPPPWLQWGLVLATAGAFLANALLERRAVRQRAFIFHFAEQTLRLDFSTPLRGRPRTLYADFDKIRALQIVAAADGALALTVDFVPSDGSPELLREVLVAFVPPARRPELERLRALLESAVARPPAAAPAPTDDAPVDAFVR